MTVLKRFVSAVEAINERAGNFASYLIPLMMLVMTYDVIARYIFNKPTVWAFETNQFLFCGTIALGGGYTLLNGRHVNVDIVYNRLKVRARATVDIITVPLMLGFIAVLLQYAVEATLESYRSWQHSSSYWSPPLFPVYTAMTIGIILMFLQGLVKLIRSLITAITGVEEVAKPGGGHR